DGMPPDDELERVQSMALTFTEDEDPAIEDKKDISTLSTSYTHRDAREFTAASVDQEHSQAFKPVLTCMIGGKKARCLFDTGSQRSHVSGRFAAKLRHMTKLRWNRAKLFAVNNKEVTPKSRIP